MCVCVRILTYSLTYITGQVKHFINYILEEFALNFTLFSPNEEIHLKLTEVSLSLLLYLVVPCVVDASILNLMQQIKRCIYKGECHPFKRVCYVGA